MNVFLLFGVLMQLLRFPFHVLLPISTLYPQIKYIVQRLKHAIEHKNENLFLYLPISDGF